MAKNPSTQRCATARTRIGPPIGRRASAVETGSSLKSGVPTTKRRLGFGAVIGLAGLIIVSFAFGRGEQELAPDTITATRQIGAFQRAPRKTDRLPFALARGRLSGQRLISAASRLVIARRAFPQERSNQNSGRVYVVPTEDNKSLCLIVEFTAGGSAAGCSTVADFLGDRGFHVAITRTGRPGSEKRMDIIAVAAARVRKLVVRTPQSRFDAAPNADGGLWLTLDSAALANGAPTALVSYDEEGNQVGSLDMPGSR